VTQIAEEMELVEAEIVEDDGPAENLPEAAAPAQVVRAREEVRTAALVAAGGVVAGAATVAAVHVARTSAKRLPQLLRRNKGPQEPAILATQSFRVDVHLLDR
jgi:hypothetical protein